MTPGSDGRPLRDILRDIADDVRLLIRGELQLARTEVDAKIERIVGAVIAMVAGALLGFAALNILLAALVSAIDEAGLGIPTWLAAAIVGLLVAAVGYLLVQQGQKALSASKMMPERTAANLQADAQLLKDKVS